MKFLEPVIELGPILGIEDDCEYSVVFLSKKKLDTSLLLLELERQDKQFRIKDINEVKLFSTYLYKFVFTTDLIEETTPVNYKILYQDKSVKNKFDHGSWQFVIPGKSTVPKIAFASCNGMGAKLPQDLSDEDYAMWDRLLESHLKEDLNYSYHCLILGGDQVYADPIWKKIKYFKDHKLLGWNSTKKFINHEKDNLEFYQLKSKLKLEIEQFYESLYINSWGKKSICSVMAQIPSIMMWDDHDIFDGWGSHDERLQSSELFQLIFSVAKKYFEALQIRTQSNKSLISKEHFSQRIRFRNYEIIALDNRTNRTSERIMSQSQYDDIERIKNGNMFEATDASLSGQKVILFVMPVPVAHLNYKERAEKWMSFFFRRNFLSSFNDDGLDHWDHKKHEKEQEKLIEILFQFGDKFKPKYIHIISGDVHSAGAGRITRLNDNDGHEYSISQLISSPIVYKPIGRLAQKFIGFVANKKSRIENYDVNVIEFGFEPFSPSTIFKRNFGFLYKSDGRGLKAYLTIEGDESEHLIAQPASYKRKIKK